MKLFKHNLNSGITKTRKKTSKEDLLLQRTELEMLHFSFGRSLRQSDFSLFTASFEAMLPWLAALNHSNYLRWGCIFLCDMHSLAASDADEFVEGHFTIKKTERIFSAIGIDQAHEQNNKSVKIDGAAIGILC